MQMIRDEEVVSVTNRRGALPTQKKFRGNQTRGGIDLSGRKGGRKTVVIH